MPEDLPVIPTSELAPAALPPREAADRLATESLIRCWIRERQVRLPEGDKLELELDVGDGGGAGAGEIDSDSALRIPVEYW